MEWAVANSLGRHETPMDDHLTANFKRSRVGAAIGYYKQVIGIYCDFARTGVTPRRRCSFQRSNSWSREAG
jgi:hypothetical protein